MNWNEFDISTMADAEAESLFIGFSGQVEPGDEVDILSEEEGDEEETEDDYVESDVGLTEETPAMWESGVVTGETRPRWKEHPSGMLQGICFAVE